MSNPAPDAGHKWNTDRPGELPEHDELDRKIFSQRVAKELRAWRKKDSLVVSLNGYWGSGKTTLANLIFYYVREQAKEEGEKQPVVVRFEPWQWSGQDLLVEAFFGKISDALGREDVGEKAGRLKAGWRKLGTLLGVGRLVVKWVGRAAEGAAAGSVAAGNAGVAVAAVSTKAIVSAVEEGLEGVQQAADAGAAAHAAAEESAATSIEAVRGELKALLMDLDAPLIVVIDDIDRLTTEQVRMLVQLVKANADFPNVVYLLLYQKSVVAKALETSICEAGQDFLKKIVQVELEVPSPPDRKLREMFGRGLERILITAETRWDRERWRTLFDEAVWPFFRTPRDIKRFLSVFEFYFDGHVTDGVLEVNPIDLVLIETLRMFDPTAYEEVSRAFQRQRNLLLEVLYDDKEAKNQFVIGVKNLVERDELGATERRRLRALLVALFPYAQESFSHSDGREQEWLRDLRICHEKHFPR